MSMVETEFRFFKENREIRFGKSVEFGKSSFSKRPKRFYSINMSFTSSEFIMTMKDSCNDHIHSK
jgi:hypothetical protein